MTKLWILTIVCVFLSKHSVYGPEQTIILSLHVNIIDFFYYEGRHKNKNTFVSVMLMINKELITAS